MKYTMIYHVLIAANYYAIELKRVRCSAAVLKRYQRNPHLHFIVKGWPKISFSSGENYFKG